MEDGNYHTMPVLEPGPCINQELLSCTPRIHGKDLGPHVRYLTTEYTSISDGLAN